MIKIVVDNLIFLNNLGLWEMLNFLLVIIGLIIGSVYFFRKRRVPMLNIFTSYSKRQGQNYTSLINIEFRNFTGCSIAICNPYFKYKDLSPDPAAHGDSYSGEYEVKFIGKNETGLIEVEVFLPHKENTLTWIPINPVYSEEKIKLALGNKKVGILYFTCIWISEKPKVRKLKINI